MKSMGVFVLCRVLSVVILSLYVTGGVSRVAALVLLALGVAGAVAGLLLRGHPPMDR